MTDHADSLADRIAELVEEHWREQSTPLLLSQLGSADQGNIGRSAKQLSTNLAGFIGDRVADRVRIVGGSIVPPVLAALPANVEEAVDVDDLLSKLRRERSSTRVQRFHPAFWAAFRVPLDESKRRFVSTRVPIRFQDTSLDGSDRAGFVEVQREYITEADDAAVHQRISAWLQTHELDNEAFLVTDNATAPTDLPRDDLLGRLLVSLESDELKRMSIPLDVVLKLRRQSL